MNIDWSKAPEGATHYDMTESRINSFMRLDGGSWFFWPPSSSNPQWTFWRPDTVDVEAMIPRPSIAAWNGEGLPPVGTVCEWHPNQDGWVQVEILGHSGEETWFRREGHESSETCLRMTFFRPIRTPEQIAAEAREKAINEMAEILTHDGSFFQDAERLYDAGYRKQAQP